MSLSSSLTRWEEVPFNPNRFKVPHLYPKTSRNRYATFYALNLLYFSIPPLFYVLLYFLLVLGLRFLSCILGCRPSVLSPKSVFNVSTLNAWDLFTFSPSTYFQDKRSLQKFIVPSSLTIFGFSKGRKLIKSKNL